MEIYDDFSHEIMADYANMLADIILGKNVAIHLPVINESLEALNSIIDIERSEGNDAIVYIKMAYCYYKLKEDANRLIKS